MARGPVGAGVGAAEPLDVKITWQLGASRQQTGFSIRANAAGLATPQDAAEYITTNIAPGFTSILPNTATVVGVDVVNAVTKEGGSTSPVGLVGLNAGALGPGFLAAVVSLKGELRSRYGQGRMFLPCMMDDWVNFETIVGTGLASLNGVVDSIVENLVDIAPVDPWRLINWHPLLPAGRPNGTVPTRPAVPASYYDVTSLRLNLQVTSLRSRKQGVGS